MTGDNYRERARLRGYMFESVVLRFLIENNFTEISTTSDKIRIQRRHFVEFRGRGEWHQIDCPCEYNIDIPFINKIRLLAEVKFYKNKIEKNLIREYIGVLKDIQENYFSEDITNLLNNRFTELGAFFSATGFTDESEKLAFAHNIKTISYENFEIIKPIIGYIYEIEKNYLRVDNCISTGNQSDFISLFREILNGQDRRFFRNRFNPSDGFDNIFQNLLDSILLIRSNFFAYTSAGVLLHFMSTDSFPEELFLDTDRTYIEIYYETDTLGISRFYLIFSDDQHGRKYYFKPPESLASAISSGGDILGEKYRHFHRLNLTKKIGEITRTLTLQINRIWLINARINQNS